MNTQSKWTQVLHSRTVGVLVLMFITDTVSVFAAHIQPDLLVLINLILTSLATYLHVNPPVQGMYTPPGVPAPDVQPIVIAPYTTQLNKTTNSLDSVPPVV